MSWKLDRLFRDCADCLTVTGQWDHAEVALQLVDMGGQAIDTSTDMGRFFLTVMAGAAEMERNLVRERTAAGMAHKKAKGERVGAVPFGYRVADDGLSLEPNPAEQRVVARVKVLRAEGLTLQAITDRLNADGTPARVKRWALAPDHRGPPGQTGGCVSREGQHGFPGASSGLLPIDLSGADLTFHEILNTISRKGVLDVLCGRNQGGHPGPNPEGRNRCGAGKGGKHLSLDPQTARIST